jgi:hypothetical protein
MNNESVVPAKTIAVMQTLMRVALGQEPADLVVSNANLVKSTPVKSRKTWGLR